jgi:hypothetical protein
MASYGQAYAVINTAGIQGQLGKPGHKVSLERFTP